LAKEDRFRHQSIIALITTILFPGIYEPHVVILSKVVDGFRLTLAAVFQEDDSPLAMKDERSEL
jgi:hypothetical protein